jgi:hypothetical protein
MKRITLILFAAIMCSTANAQTKTDALNEYINRIDKNLNGTNVTPDSGIVVFKYERSEVTRHSDGVKNFEAVLKGAAMFQNSVSWGNMKTIIVNGKTFGGLATATPERVKPLFGDEKPTRSFYTMADSATMKRGADGVKQGYDDISKTFGTAWGYFFGLFEYMLWPILSVGFVALLWSMIAKLEHQHTGKWYDSVLLHMQRGASFVLFIIVSIVASFYLLKWLFDASAWDMPLPAKVLIFYGVVYAISWLASFVIPNAKPNNGGFFKSKGGNDEYERKQLQNRN